MSITGVSGYGSTYSLSKLYATQETDDSDSTSSCTSIGSSSTRKSDSLDLSKPGEIYSKLQELAKSDPEKLKEVCANIADKLKSASESSNGRDSKMLTDLAQKFQNVADGGDVSQLKPPEPPSFGDGAQPPIDQYAGQQDAQTMQMMGHRGGHDDSGNGMQQLMSSIMDELNSAVS